MEEDIKIPNVPLMPPSAVERLERALKVSSCYMEYGSGGSTHLASYLGVPAVISIESDAEWLRALENNLKPTPKSRHILLHADIGPTVAWGHPADSSGWRNWHEYPLAGWKACRTHFLSPDLILIDGRFRKACFYASLIFGKPGTVVLFDDYGDRVGYHGVEIFCRPTAMHDRMAEFIIPSFVDKELLWLALLGAVSDPG